MGKKKSVKKAKEISSAIAESSPTAENQAKRKRGRPRKINIQKNEEKTAKEIQEGEGGDNKQKQKKIDEITEKSEGSSAKSEKEEEKSGDKELQKVQHHSRSRARRKSKPTKSS